MFAPLPCHECYVFCYLLAQKQPGPHSFTHSVVPFVPSWFDAISLPHENHNSTTDTMKWEGQAHHGNRI